MGECAHALRAGRRLAPLALILLAAAMLAAYGHPQHGHAQLESATVHYAAGWNLVAAPTGTVLEKAAGQQFAFGPGSLDYQPIRRGEIIAGRAVWAYFPQATDVSFGRSASEYARTIAPANQWLLVGNPSTTDTLPLSGADMALAYDSSQGYVPVRELKPGQGAWVFSFSGADIQVGKAPAGSEKMRALEAGLTKDATDLSNFAALPSVASELIAARQYDAVQSGMDDLRGAFADGLRIEGSAPTPSLTTVQINSLNGVREALAKAKAAADAGDLSTADAAVNEAKQLGQTGEDDAAALQRGRSSGGSSVFSALLQFDQNKPTPQNLAAYGALCLAAIPALGMAVPPSQPFIQLVVATLNGTPVPAAATPTPQATPPPTAPTAVPAPCTGATLILATNGIQFGSAVPVGFQASGLDPSSPFAIFAGKTQISTGTTDAGGGASGSFVVPPSSPPPVTIAVATAKKCGTATLTVVTPPPASNPMPRTAPEMQ